MSSHSICYAIVGLTVFFLIETIGYGLTISKDRSKQTERQNKQNVAQKSLEELNRHGLSYAEKNNMKRPKNVSGMQRNRAMSRRNTISVASISLNGGQMKQSNGSRRLRNKD